MRVDISLGDKTIGYDHPTYFIADIAANHDGDLERAKSLITLAAESGADAVKFQNHNCAKYVSDYGFKNLGNKMSHQKNWKKSIYEVYKDAEVPVDWTEDLKKHAEKEKVEYFTTPYDLDMVDVMDKHVNVYKIGSGDVAWDEMLIKVAKKNKPVLLACGAANIGEVQHAVDLVREYNPQVVLMQCNTNYTVGREKLKYVCLNVLKTFEAMYPDLILGLSDHTAGHATVVGSVALGARVIEKHFTDDTTRDGPDHPFSMDPASWRAMVDVTRELEAALGSSNKTVQDNERETVVLQRRCARAKRPLKVGEVVTRDCVEMQRPAPEGSIAPNDFHLIEERALKADVAEGEHVSLDKIG